ncbi:initiation-control protein YabA [Halonatronum saccharophilum]|uniref:initiation-control protein YabA n=1 Tax=Halonatronum saccharophilum TaxID=150060 RepID=UPI0004828F36|nr:initiation control protein YabA [Halonatronum saccharophilum]
MEEIISLLAHFQEELQVLTNDFQKVKNKIYNVYKENEALKEENENLKRLVFEKEESDDQGPIHDNLSKLYSEGFHVCHLNFGESRQGDCLFCMGLLADEEAGKDEG